MELTSIKDISVFRSEISAMLRSYRLPNFDPKYNSILPSINIRNYKLVLFSQSLESLKALTRAFNYETDYPFLAHIDDL